MGFDSQDLVELDCDVFWCCRVPGGAGDKLKKPTGVLEHLWGLTHIEEQILDLKLDIDPNFYFQVLTTVVFFVPNL